MRNCNLQIVTGLKSILGTIAFSFLVNAAYSQSIQTGNPFPGQTPPVNTPKIFAPGIISLDNRFETYPTFSPDGKEIYFSVVNADWSEGKILHTQVRNGKWSKPETALFSNNNYINWESFISPDGNRQFFTSNRPPSSNTDIWMIERISDTTWTSPVQLSNPVNSGSVEGSACVTGNGTLYFKSLRGGGIGGSVLYRAKLTDRAYLQVENLGTTIKTGLRETEPFMSTDESYLIFISEVRAGGHGGWDLWVCFKNKDNSWSVPVNMGANINSANDEYGPRVTPDGKYMFFTREERGKTMDIYWVSASIISSLKPTDMQDSIK